MRHRALPAGAFLLAAAIIGATLPRPARAVTDNASLEQEKSRLELEASIEKTKADIALSRKTRWEADRAEAEAEKAGVLAKQSLSKTEALPGSVDARNFGSAGLIVAVDLAKELAPRLCGVIDQDTTAMIYDGATISGITSARLLDTQLALFQDSLAGALREHDDGQVSQFFFKSIGLDAVVATGTIKAVADLAALFKTNIAVGKTDFAEAKSLLLTAMADSCPGKLTSLGFGYAGELETTEFEALRTKASHLLSDRAQLEMRIAQTRKELDAEKDKDGARRKSLQASLDDLSAVGRLVDGFIAALKPNETSDKSPLAVAARYLALSRRTAGSLVLDIDFRLEGLTIIKESFFTGQKLRLSATAITWYRLHEKAGTIVKAGVWREIAKPVQVDLRGVDASDAFWSRQ